MRWVSIRIGGLLLSGLALAAHADYANDRAEIENLSARYFIAMDALDGETYASLFVPDGELIYGGGVARGRDELHDVIANWKNSRSNYTPGTPFRPRLQHSVSNQVIEVNGDTATQIAYWTAHKNSSPKGDVEVMYIGHYVDELVRVGGRWYFKKREIFNEGLPSRYRLFYPELGEKDPNAE